MAVDEARGDEPRRLEAQAGCVVLPLGATFAVALLKLGLATSFVDSKHSGFARDVEEKRQRVLSALMPRH